VRDKRSRKERQEGSDEESRREQERLSGDNLKEKIYN